MLYSRSALVVLAACACVVPLRAQTLITQIPVSNIPYGVAVNPTTNRIYVAVGNTQVAVIDGSTNKVVATVSAPASATFIAVNMTTGYVYSAGCCSVTVIDGHTNQIVATVPVNGSGIGVQGLAVNPVTNQIYVSDDSLDELMVIDGYTNVASYVNTGNIEMLGLAVDFATGQILAAPSGDVLDVINPASYQITQIKVGQINQGVAVNSFTSRAYITNNSGISATLGVVNLVTGRAGAITLSGTPQWVCVDYLTNRVFVSSGPGVTEINGENNAIVGSVDAQSGQLDVNPSTRLVYASAQVAGDYVVNVISE